MLELEQPAELNQVHELLHAEELRIVDRRRDEAPGLEYARYRVEAWDEDSLRLSFLCDAFAHPEREGPGDQAGGTLTVDRQLNLRQAYLTMFEFLRMRNERASSDELIDMLSAMQLLPDGDSADSEQSREFVEALDRVLRDESEGGYREADIAFRPPETS